MKKILNASILIVILFLSGCQETIIDDDNNDVDDVRIIVSFETFGGTIIDNMSIKKSSTIENPQIPEKEGYVFTGWYLEETLDTSYKSDFVFTKDTTLYAGYEPITTKVHVHNKDYDFGYFVILFNEEKELQELDFEGFTFDGWYSDDTYKTKITKVIGLTQDIDIYFKLIKDEVVLGEDFTQLDTLDYYSYLNDQNPVVTINVKNVGSMTLQLFPEVAKNTVDNFLVYVLNESYTDSEFHRIIDNFMIQGGIVLDTQSPIEGEFSDNGIENPLLHTVGVISMARTSDMNSATSQFFIMDETTPYLDGKYASFGGLTSGFNVLEYLSQVLTLTTDEPFEPVIIESITVELNGYVPDTPTYYQK